MEISTSYDSSTYIHYADATVAGVTIASYQVKMPDTSDDAIDKFLRECSPVELLEDINLIEHSPETSVRSKQDEVTRVIDPNEYDRGLQVLQVCKTKSRAKAYRCSRKKMIEVLCNTASSLEAKLQFLEVKKAKNYTSGRISSPRMHKLWRHIALSQLDRRRKSESENASLREMVRIQILEAKNLRRILKRRTRIESMEEVCGVKGVKKLLKDTSTDNQHIFQRLLLEADQLYIGVDNVFSSKGFDKMPYTGYVRATNVDIVDGVYYEMSQRRLFPFSLLATENAVWECLRRLGMNSLHGVGASNAHVNVHPFAIVEEGNTLRSSFFTVISGTGDHIGNMNWKVARRYKDAGRTTFTCRIVSESTFQGRESSFSSTYTMQIVMNKAAEDADMTTVMIYFSAERATLPAQDDPVTQIVCAAWDKHIPRFPIDVESVLLDSIYNTSDD